MRVVSWNIRLGLEIEGAIEALSTNRQLKDADLILLQEMDDIGPGRIADALGLESAYAAGCTVKGTGKPFGNAVLARGGVDEPVVLRLPYPGRVLGLRSRIATQCTVNVEPLGHDNSYELMVWSVHAEIPTLPHLLQLAQYQTVADRVSEFHDANSIVGGDFNTVSGRSVRGLVERMERAGLKRVLPAGQTTLSRFGRSFELDHIFATGFAVASSGRVRVHGVSDHDAVWAVLEPAGS